MTSRCRLFGSVWSGMLLLLGGCATGGAVMPAARHGEPAAQLLAQVDPLLDPTLTAESEQTRIARSQRPDKETLPAPGVKSVSATGLASPMSPQAQGGRPQLTVRAWVNEKPIFDDEVMTAVARQAPLIRQVPPDQQEGYVAKLFNEELNRMIERELILQDAYHKLSKNEKFLEKLKQAAAKDFDKKLRSLAKRLTKDGESPSVEQLRAMMGKENLESMRRQEERNFIAQEYIRTRVFPRMQQVNHDMIREYYQQHLSEFRTVDRVKWQDIFIAVGANHPTIADARRAAQDIIARVKQGEGFDTFLSRDEGLSWSHHKGEGTGQLRGEIKPPELEPYLFQMTDGQVGPYIELSTGVHVFRLLKRDSAGQLPFDDKVQLRVSSKLKNEIAEREYKCIIRELKERAVVRVEKGPRS